MKRRASPRARRLLALLLWGIGAYAMGQFALHQAELQMDAQAGAP